MFQATTKKCLVSAEPRPISEILGDLLPRYLEPSCFANHLQCVTHNTRNVGATTFREVLIEFKN